MPEKGDGAGQWFWNTGFILIHPLLSRKRKNGLRWHTSAGPGRQHPGRILIFFKADRRPVKNQGKEVKK